MVFVCILANVILGIIVYLLLDFLIKLLVKIKWIGKCYDKVVERTQHKIEKWVEKYGWIGVGLFIGVPLPGSGVYTGALAAYLIGLKFKKFLMAEILGVLIAAAIVTFVVLSGASIFTYIVGNV